MRWLSMPRVRIPEAASGLARVAAGSMVRRGCAGSGRAVATVAAPRALEVAAAAAGVPGAEGSGRRGHRGHGQGAAERPRAASAVRKQERLHWWREGRREAAREGQGEGGGGGRLRGAGGAWGRGRKLLEQQPRATSITFNFKRERGSWKSTGVAIWQRHGKRRLRGPGSAAEHLWTRRRRRENESPGGGSRGGTASAVEALRRAALAGRGGRAPAASVEVEGPAAARPPRPSSPPPRPLGPTAELGGSPPPEVGRAPLLPAAERPGSRRPRATPAARQLAPRTPGQIAGGFLAADSFPVFSSPSSVASLLSFLSFQ